MDKRIRKMRRYVNPHQKTYFDKLVINVAPDIAATLKMVLELWKK